MAVVALVGVSACGGSGGGDGAGGGGTDVERYEASGDVPGAGRIVASDGRLVGLGADDSAGPETVVVSEDAGRTWRAAELPDRPAELQLMRSDLGLVADGDLVAVLGVDPTSTSPALPVPRSQFLVWTSTGGDRWQAHAIDTSGPLVGNPTLVALGDALVASTSTSAGFDVFVSRDRGASWDRADVTGLVQAAGEGLAVDEADAASEGLAVDEADAAGGRLRLAVGPTTGPGDRRQVLTSEDGGATWSAASCELRCLDPPGPGEPVVEGGRVTTDGGATWHDIAVEPPPRGDEGPYLSRPVEVPGGWLAAARSSEVGDVDYGMLLRSEDGRSWRQMVPDDCRAGRTNSSVSDPVRFRDRWHVTYGCANLMDAESAVVYAAGPDARSFEPVEGTERADLAFGDPIDTGDRLLLPEHDDHGRLVAVTALG